jgi:protein-disulfide isomerase
MEQDEMDDNRWVNDRLSSLDPPTDWQPNSSAAFARLRRREKPVRRLWLWATLSATAAAGCGVLLLVSTPSACANPLGCSQSAQSEHQRPAPAPTVSAAIPKPVPARPHVAVPPSFKESGSATAPITCEVYTDYECPHCAAFYLETLPQVTTRYVEKGKVRLIHRDFPLPQHRFARVAALYADAAGEAGYYDAVAGKLFRTQLVWSGDGNVDAQVSTVVPPAAMEKVRAEAREDSAAGKSVAADEAQARDKHIERTPAMLCNGQTIGPDLSFKQIESQLDALSSQH